MRRPKLTIRIPARTPSIVAITPKTPPPNAPKTNVEKIPYAQCTKSDCRRYLPPNCHDDLCIWCRWKQKGREEVGAQHEDQLRIPRASIDENQESRAEAAATILPPKLLQVTDFINQELLSGNVIKGARICTPCQHIMPPRSEYPFDACYFCRIKSREPKMKQSQRQSKDTQSDISDDEEILNVARVEENIIPVPHPGRCRNRDCGVMIHSSSECWQCMNRRTWNKKRGATRGDAVVAVSEKISGMPMRGTTKTPSCCEWHPNRPVNRVFCFLCATFKLMPGCGVTSVYTVSGISVSA